MSSLSWHIMTSVVAVVVLIEGLLVLSVLRHLGGILLRLGPESYGDVEQGPPVGSVVPRHLMASPPGLLLFVSSTCSLCKPVIARLPALRRTYPDLQLIPVAVGPGGRGRSEFVDSLGPGARGDLRDLYQEWGIPGTPYAVAVGEEGRIVARGVPNTVVQVEVLAETALGARDASDDEPSEVHTSSVLSLSDGHGAGR